MNNKERLLILSLVHFYSEECNFEVLMNILKKNKKHYISLRLLDWLITNYAKKNNIVYTIEKKQQPFNVFLEYKNQLKSFQKRYFDPFCRRQRVFFSNTQEIVFLKDKKECDIYRKRPDGVVTTLAQLNAFRWFIENDIIKYAANHTQKIEDDMIESEKITDHRKKNNNHDKRKILSKSAYARGYTTCNIEVVVSFN